MLRVKHHPMSHILNKFYIPCFKRSLIGKFILLRRQMCCEDNDFDIDDASGL